MGNEEDMLKRGDQLPHFRVTTTAGQVVRYTSIWQHRNVVLVLLPAADDSGVDRYIGELTNRRSDFEAHDAVCVITRDALSNVDAGVVIADRWGEIAHVSPASRIEDFPDADALIEWTDYVRMKCPECEGEAR